MPSPTRVVIVTGGATSIGAAIVRAFAAEGAAVVIADIAAEGAALAAALGERCAFVPTDLADDDQVRHCVAEAARRYGGIDAVVHVACTYVDGGLRASRQDWHRSYDVNVVGAAMLVKAAVPHMQARGGGAVLLMGSISAKVAQAGRWLYPASKAALLQLARSMALDLAPMNIRVNTLSPGKTWSAPLAAKHGGDRPAADAAEGAYHMIGRLADPAEVANVATFICSPRASFVTGADFAVDGGYSAMGPERADVHKVRAAS